MIESNRARRFIYTVMGNRKEYREVRKNKEVWEYAGSST